MQKVDNDRRAELQRQADESRDHLLREVNEQLKELRGADQQKRNEFVVVRQTKLRRSRNGKSEAISGLYPNNVVALIERGKDWSYVEFFDVIDGTAKRGWVLKKYIQPLRRS